MRNQCYAVCSVLFDYRVETEISVCLETQKLLSQGPLIGQHSQLSSLHICVTQGQGVGALVNALFTLLCGCIRKWLEGLCTLVVDGIH